jgi:hypothetical protein
MKNKNFQILEISTFLRIVCSVLPVSLDWAKIKILFASPFPTDPIKLTRPGIFYWLPRKKKNYSGIFFGSVLETRENYGVSVLSKTGKVEQTLIINTLKKIGSKNTWEDFFRGVVIHVPLLYICKIWTYLI